MPLVFRQHSADNGPVSYWCTCTEQFFEREFDHTPGADVTRCGPTNRLKGKGGVRGLLGQYRLHANVGNNDFFGQTKLVRREG